jgi:hypothetical protein
MWDWSTSVASHRNSISAAQKRVAMQGRAEKRDG